jgi:hypothetical protein
MAVNSVYQYAKSLMLQGLFDWAGSTFYGCLTTASYVPNFVTDSTYAAFSANILSTVTGVLTGLAVSSAGVASANSLTLSGISASQTATWIVVFYNPGTPGFPVCAFNTGTGLPYTTTGAAITIDWNNVSPSGPLFTL